MLDIRQGLLTPLKWDFKIQQHLGVRKWIAKLLVRTERKTGSSGNVMTAPLRAASGKVARHRARPSFSGPPSCHPPLSSCCFPVPCSQAGLEMDSSPPCPLFLAPSPSTVCPRIFLTIFSTNHLGNGSTGKDMRGELPGSRTCPLVLSLSPFLCESEWLLL